jgi:glycosyltransferase involved in cell wall biosynthesis
MQIVMITDNDPAGMAIAFTKAINACTDHRCRLISSEERYGFDYETDIHIPDIKNNDFSEVEEVLSSSDIIHFHMLRDENSFLGPLLIKDYAAGKKILHHHHGHPVFRSDPEHFREKYHKLRRRAIVSTPDLLKLLPESVWVPNMVPLNDQGHTPLEPSADDSVRICQAPTRKDLKNTDEFICVTQRLKEKYPHIESLVIERIVHRECLEIKRSCHIHFDHMQGYFGVSSLESLSQGKPVIAGIDDWCMAHIKAFTGSDKLPWVIARDEDALQSRMEHLIVDHDFREQCGHAGRAFMTTTWNEHQVIRRLLDVYESL